MPPRSLSFDGQQSGWSELAGANPMFINCVAQSPAGVRSRPGIRAWSKWPASVPSTTAVVAMAPFAGGLVYVTADRNVFAYYNGAVIQLSSAADQQIDGSLRPNIAITRSFCLIVGGGAVQKVTTGFASSRLGGNPPQSADVSALTQYVVLLRNDESGLFDWDTPGDGGIEDWEPDINFREAEARPDPLVACRDTSRELWMFGTKTVQIYTPDPDETFTPGPTIDEGTIARQSPIKHGQAMAWLADGKRILNSDSGSPTDLTDIGMAADFKGLRVVDDCWGFRCVIGNMDFLVWVFPTAGRTFAFEAKKGVWSEWRSWRDGRWVAWIPQSYAYWEEESVHLVGLEDGSIAELSLDATEDDTYAIRCVARMGFSPAPTEADTVQANELRLQVQSSGVDGAIDVRWRDGLGAFTEMLHVAFTQQQPTALVCPCGVPFRQRQYEFSWTASDAVYLASVTEVLEEVEL